MAAGFEDFTDRSRRVLQLAREAARELGHSHIGTEHLLIGLSREGRGVASAVLKNLGVTPEKIEAETRLLLGIDHGIPGVGDRLLAVMADGRQVGAFTWRDGKWVLGE